MLAEMEADLVAAGMAPLYARNRSVAMQVLGFAEDAGLISHTPRPRRRRKAPMQQEPRFLAPERLRAVAEAAPPDMAALFEFAWLTGLRAGELLTGGPHDIEGSVCRVRWAVEGRTRRMGPVKSHKARRDVDLSPRALRAAGDGERALLAPLLFHGCSSSGSKAMRRAGEAPGGLHLLRHSNLALRIADGHELVYIADQLGHADPAFTLRAYGHLIRRPGASASSPDETIAQLIAGRPGLKGSLSTEERGHARDGGSLAIPRATQAASRPTALPRVSRPPSDASLLGRRPSGPKPRRTNQTRGRAGGRRHGGHALLGESSSTA
jgi:hypothetical protein